MEIINIFLISLFANKACREKYKFYYEYISNISSQYTRHKIAVEKFFFENCLKQVIYTLFEVIQQYLGNNCIFEEIITHLKKHIIAWLKVINIHWLKMINIQCPVKLLHFMVETMNIVQYAMVMCENVAIIGD